jgi:hypothetical protein
MSTVGVRLSNQLYEAMYVQSVIFGSWADLEISSCFSSRRRSPNGGAGISDCGLIESPSWDPRNDLREPLQDIVPVRVWRFLLGKKIVTAHERRAVPPNRCGYEKKLQEIFRGFMSTH